VPTLSGTLFWNETISVFGYLGIITLIPILIISGTSPKKQDNKQTTKAFIIPLIIALLSSGGLGVMQKIHQKSDSASQMNTFLLLSFIFAFIVSLIFTLALKKGQSLIEKKTAISSLSVGTIFSICNILNTYLAGVLDSAVLFPILNIGTILISLALSVIIYKEKLDKRDTIIIILGALAIILVNL
jgi:drug/metabolite transporter (DMT)-like permease